MTNSFDLPATEESFYVRYLQILNGIARLSDKEILVLSQLMNYADRVGNDGIEESDVYQKETATVNRLKKKGLLTQVGEAFRISERIYVSKQGGATLIFRLRVV